MEWSDLLPRFHVIPDDGHTIKLVRALDVCRQICAPYEDKPWRKIKGDDVWLKLHYMVLDSTENPGGEGRWVRSAGFDEMWEVSLHIHSALLTTRPPDLVLESKIIDWLSLL